MMSQDEEIRKQLKSFRDDIELYKDIPLSDGDIMKIVDGKSKVVTYPNIHKYSTLDELLSPFGSCCILYETHEHYGHWVCLTIRPEYTQKGKQIVEYFDSYGKMPDAPLDIIPAKFAMESKQDYPYLTSLMANCPYKISYNEHQFQKMSPNVKDCGRWISIRILMKDLPLEMFCHFFKGLYSDSLATLLTMDEEQLNNGLNAGGCCVR